MPLDYIVHVVLAPMIFLMMWKHSVCACIPDSVGLRPELYMQAQVDNVLYGLMVRPDDAQPPSSTCCPQS